MFHQKLKGLRISNGMTQKSLAEKLNVSQQCISDWETGIRKPPIDMLIKIALLFHVSTDYLLGMAVS